MPIKIQSDLPAKEILEFENIFVMDENRAMSQEIRPLQIGILNLMPIKEETELQLLRALSNTPLQVDITFIKVSSHVSLNTSSTHLNKFYHNFDDIKHRKFDGLIITGAPVEQLEFEEVNYWKELCTIMDWSKEYVTSTFHICWGAQAGIFHHYGINKELLDKKLFGVYSHDVLNRKISLVRGFDDSFYLPHSRHTTISRKEVYECEALTVLAESKEAGVVLISAGDGKQIFLMGHPEYDRFTLHNEYIRDINKGLEIDVPKNYYPGDDATKKPKLLWRSHSNNLYTNWLNYYV
ncbi:MAG: homoserine O-acetyltransferase MetA, partial [Lachnospiraceae bacterium]